MKISGFTAREADGFQFASVYFDGDFETAKTIFGSLERMRSDDDTLEYCHSDAYGGCVVIILNRAERVVKIGDVVTITRH